MASYSVLQRFVLRVFFSLVIISLAACGTANPGSTQVSPSGNTPLPQTSYAEVTFEALLPEKLAENQSLYIEILDEVTGLALNPSRARMSTSDGQFYGIKIPVSVGSVVKYRYFRDNDPIGVEYTTGGQQVRYRLYYASGPGVVHDTVAGWRSNPPAAVPGRIHGQVADKTNNAPVINALVTAGGMQTLTSSDGSFVLEGLSPGLHNLVVYSLNGAFQPFQQGAIVAPESATPALALLTPSPMVTVHFTVTPPEGSPAGVPIRLLGNTYTLGNTFADLNGGMSVLASRAPLMQAQPDGRYTLTLQLPAGLDLRYKYSLGDGLWNSERTATESVSGDMVIRQIVVPAQEVTVQDKIANWKTPGFGPITFTVTVPENTPQDDIVSIQFNPFGWTQPIPMWRVAQNRWFYVLYNPLNQIANASYRYCRNEQCTSATAADTQGNDANQRAFTPSNTEQQFKDTVENWAWMNSAAEPVVISGAQIATRDANFMAGVEFSSKYLPSWQPYLGPAFRSAREMGSNTVVLAPTWHATHNTPPVLSAITGQDPLWFDLTQMNVQAQQQNLSVVLHPQLRYEGEAADWWKTAARDDGWWQTWFARYSTFLIYHADLATQTGAKALIIGDESILPALPGGKLADGSSSNVPGDAETRWDSLIELVKTRYSGKIAWMVPVDGSETGLPKIPQNVDLLYAQIAPPLPQINDSASIQEIESAMTALLDGKLLKLQEETNLPIIIGIRYPSARGSLDGCIGSNESCIPLEAFELPGAQIAIVEPGMEEQAYVYNAALAAINQRSWIAGFISTGYYPPAELKDLSTSVRGKPAGEVLGYWYAQLLGNSAP